MIDNLHELAQLIESQQRDLLAQWREQVRELPSARHLDVPTLNDHIPRLLEELVSALRTGRDTSFAEALGAGSSPVHGVQRVHDGFDIEEVVAEYHLLRGCIHDVAERHRVSMQGEPFYILNRVLDGAIGSAVASFAAKQALDVQRRREEHLAFVAHDLRTPLNAISLSSSVLELILARNGSETPESTQKLRILNRNIRHLEALISKVLSEASSVGTDDGISLVRRRFDLWPLVESLVHDLNPIADADGVRLVNEIPDDLVVYADAAVLRRIFQNLLSNAISYAPHGAVVVGASITAHDNMVTCFVRDNGTGIPADLLLRVFDKHESDPEREGGLGLGLAIVKSFVEAHDGTVDVESELGAGTTFTFTLPGQ